MPNETTPKRQRGPIVDAPETSVKPSVGAVGDTDTPKGTQDTPAVVESPETPVAGPVETPAMAEVVAKMEAKAASEPERPPHPYKWRIESAKAIPFGMRDPATGEPSKERIESAIDNCWRVGTAPEIAGVLIMLPKATD